jgi:hypothetical protein
MRGSRPLALARPFRYIPPTVAKVYIVTFRSHDDRWPLSSWLIKGVALQSTNRCI